jgi:hypothetical protein
LKLQIEVNEQQEKFLKKFAAKHYGGAEDNLSTVMPIHVVENMQYEYFPYDADLDDYYSECELVFTSDEDYETWYSDETEMIRDSYEWRGEEAPNSIIPYKDAEYEEITGVDNNNYLITGYKDYFKAYGVRLIEVAWRKPTYSPTAFFFIRDEAKRYIEYQRHNLRKPRIFSYSPGYANYGDYTHFYELLFNIGYQLNKESKDEQNKA